MQTKKEIRAQVLQQRKAMEHGEVERLSEIICGKIKELPEYNEATDLCLYMPVNNEVDLTYLFEGAWSAGKRTWLPKTIGRRMEFMKFDPDTPLSLSAFKTLEPESDEVLEPDENTLILVPGVAYSTGGDRLGYGSGFYDKYLEQWHKCTTVAACYDFQIVPEIPAEEHDIKPDFVISEKQYWKNEK